MSPDAAVRLAEATPWVIQDVLVPGLALLLLSRLWVAAAPDLGRRLARLALAVALPLLLVASLAAHVAAPRAARELSEGVDYTAFFVCFPLGLVCLAAFLFRLARRLLRAPEPARPRSSTRRAERLRLAGATFPVVALVAIVQWDAGKDEVEALNRRASDLKTTVKALEATEKESTGFAHERRLLAEKIETIHRIVPSTPCVEDVVSLLEAQASQCHVEVVDWSSWEGEAGEVLHEHAVQLVLGGQLQRLKELAARSQRLARLLVWRRVSVRGGQAVALLTVYSAPDRPGSLSHDTCVHPLSKVWLWPYTTKMRLARAEVDRLCAERERHASTMAELDEYTVGKARLGELVKAIEKVRAGRTLPEIVVEPPPPEEPEGPLPRKET